MKHYYLLFILFCLPFSKGFAQDDPHLNRMAGDIKSLQKKAGNKAFLNQLVLRWSESSMPKITLMDEIGRDANEYKGDGANKFRMNQLVTFVYDRQNRGMVSKGDYFNSTEKGIHYSAIEKTVSKGKTVTYTLKGHSGTQEFLFIPFNKKSKYSAKVNNSDAQKKDDGVQYVRLAKVNKQDEIHLSITYDQTNSAKYESFVILNYNRQEP